MNSLTRVLWLNLPVARLVAVTFYGVRVEIGNVYSVRLYSFEF